MASSQLPIEAFPAWALLNNVEFPGAELRNVEGKGFGLVANKDIASKGNDINSTSTVFRVPRDLVLSAEAIEEYAKVDQNFKQLLEAAGRQSARGDIMLYLLAHLVTSKRGQSTSRGCASTPWTEYIKFLPRPIPVPTMWSEDERRLLKGTSLEFALEAKLSALVNEFDELREKSSELSFWNALFWENETATLSDWVLADAWYRSRCLELPQAGHAMVPGLDMANHSQIPTAYYDEDYSGDAVLLVRPGCDVSSGEEITISYGDSKSAAEMLFSYGFIDKDSTAQELTLHLDALPDDPLGKAKLHIFNGPPTVRLSQVDQKFKWESPFFYLACLNEEDGLEFRVLQDKSGDRQLKLFWQGDDVTERTGDFETLVLDHPLCQVFKLRAVAVVAERLAMQLDRISSGISPDELGGAEELNPECIRTVEVLREVETRILEGVVEVLENEGKPQDDIARGLAQATAASFTKKLKTLIHVMVLQKTNLLADAHVVAYLGSMEDTQNDQASGQLASNEDEDFS